ncbi:hypothetical protein PNOK_0171400 [Pyrrhoderma noxium]|uniref:Uncharacterized protein n=1 Tax=Pyrrhoderma noxium TaxID=2282107 RepID=A0A286UQA1_9AGAM|nr:hypothetical protein PNOK_0171400 [Pyrrhoderma noxium]
MSTPKGHPATPSTAVEITANKIPQPAPLRSRQQGGRKKVLPPIEPDSIYRAESVSAPLPGVLKRLAQDPSHGEPRKRKRIEQAGAATSHAAGPSGVNLATPTNNSAHNHGVIANATADGEPQQTLFEFSTLPTSALYRYIIQHDLIPTIYPTPLTADDPPPPSALLDPVRMASRAPSPDPTPTPANRPKRGKDTSRRRSTRLLEEEMRGLDQIQFTVAVRRAGWPVGSRGGIFPVAWRPLTELSERQSLHKACSKPLSPSVFSTHLPSNYSPFLRSSAAGLLYFLSSRILPPLVLFQLVSEARI